AGRSARWCGVAHSRLRQELLDALLRRAHRAAPGDAEPDAGNVDGPERPRRSTLWTIPALSGTAAPNAGTGREQRATSHVASSGQRRRGFFHDPEIHAREVREKDALFGTETHRRD